MLISSLNPASKSEPALQATQAKVTQTNRLASLLLKASQNLSIEELKTKIQKQLAMQAWNINYQEDNSSALSLLHEAVLHAEPKLVQALLKAGADIEIQDALGQTPLHLAAQSDQTEIITILIEHGAHINARDHQHNTPLLLASKNSAIQSAELLLRLGAFHQAVDSERLSFDRVLSLDDAPFFGDKRHVARLLAIPQAKHLRYC